jgi:hypothetical protein
MIGAEPDLGKELRRSDRDLERMSDYSGLLLRADRMEKESRI